MCKGYLLPLGLNKYMGKAFPVSYFLTEHSERVNHENRTFFYEKKEGK